MARRLAWAVLVCSSLAACAPSPSANRRTSGVPAELEGERARAENDPAHQPRLDGDVVRLGAAEIREGVAHLGGELAIALVSLGRSEATPVTGRATTLVGPEVQIARAEGVVEWWRSLASGIEHGVTLTERPTGEGPLTLTIALGEGMRAEASDDARSVALVSADGQMVARYGQLFVVDANGRRVPSRLLADGPVARIEVLDGDAAYPLVIDPLVVMSIGRGPIGDPDPIYYDVSVADSGNRVMVGTNSYLRGSGTTWSLEPTFNPVGGAAGVLSADGDAAIDTRLMVWRLSGSTWMTSSPLPMAPIDCYRVAMSRDENVVVATCTSGVHTWVARAHLTGVITVAGFPRVSLTSTGDRLLVGTSVYTRSPTGWTLEQALTAPGGSTGFGRDGGISGDGTRVVLGARYTSAAGSSPAYVFLRTGTSWALEASLPSRPTSSDLDASVAIDAEGSAILVGLTRADGNVYLRSGTTWTRTELPDPPGAPGRVGERVGLSSSGTVGAVTTGEGPAMFSFTGSGPLGAACTADDGCRGGICVDGVCCESACGDGALDCQACAVAAGGTLDGRCTALSAAVAPTVTCLAAAGACDVAEVCTPSSTACPADRVLPGDTVCRAAAPGGCDVAERCDGRSAVCAGDAAAPSGTPCGGGASGPCGLGGACDGGGVCIQGYRPAGTICEPSAGDCDVDDVCDGVSAECAPRFQPSSVVCRAPSGACDVAEACTGASTDCPIDGYVGAGVVCNGAVDGPCDVADTCTGASGECIPAYRVGVVCRAQAGGCDIEEVCLGDSAECPDDAVTAEGSVCRESTAACDASEACDGRTPMCPADVSTCLDVGTVPADAMPDGGGGDAGPPPAAASCGCRAGASDASAPLWLALGLALVARRRRRAPLAE